MSRRSRASSWPWVATLDLPDGWVELPSRNQRQPLLPSRDPFLKAAKQLVDMGSIPEDMVKRTQLYFSRVLPNGGMGLAGAGRVRGTTPDDSVLENCWVVGPSSSTWDSVDGMARFATEHPVPERSVVEPPVDVPAALGPAVRLRHHKKGGQDRLDDVVTYWVWLTETAQTLSVAGSYHGGTGNDWDRFLVDVDSMVATLKLSGVDGTDPGGLRQRR